MRGLCTDFDESTKWSHFFQTGQSSTLEKMACELSLEDRTVLSTGRGRGRPWEAALHTLASEGEQT